MLTAVSRAGTKHAISSLGRKTLCGHRVVDYEAIPGASNRVVWATEEEWESGCRRCEQVAERSMRWHRWEKKVGA